MLKGFQKFVMRANLVDMAVGVVMGSAVTSVVSAIVNNFINPLISMIFGQPNLNHVLTFTWNNATISIGAIISALINFLIVASTIYFFILLPFNKFRELSAALLAVNEHDSAEEKAKKQQSLPPEEQTVMLLKQIRDELISNRSHTAGTEGEKNLTMH